MKNKTKFSLFIVLVLSSCSHLLSNLAGVKKLEEYNETAYKDKLTRITSAYQYEFLDCSIDSATYHNLFISSDTIIQKNLYQPIQILYFENNTLVSFHANCYAPGLINLNWNLNNRFGVFPPISADTSILGEKIDTHRYNRLFNSSIRGDAKYGVFLIWTSMLERNSRHAYNEIVRNLKLSGKHDSTSLLLVNTDDFWYKSMKE